MTEKHPAQLAVVILAAGQGTRMKSKLPKVLHQICGRALIEHVLVAAYGLNPQHVVAVVRHEKELVAGHISAFAPETIICEQDDVPGTGRAVEQAIGMLPAAFQGSVVVLSGDVPLITADTLQDLIATHYADGRQMSILSAVVQDPTGLGRILRGSSGEVVGIVEEKDASSQQRAVKEINGGVYVFERTALAAALAQIDTNNAQGEKYLTDAAAKIIAAGGSVAAVATSDTAALAGVNDRVQLSQAAAELNRRTIEKHQRAGVTVVAPANTYIDVTVQLGQDVTIEPGTLLRGFTTVASDAVIGPDTTLVDAVVGAGSRVVRSEVNGAEIGAQAVIGPYSFVRPETVLGANGKIGAFVEIKKSVIGAESKIPHLSYVGDAVVGQRVNLGAGTIVANYDGVKKHQTVIADEVRVGSKSVLVAPVTLGAGAYTGAGAVVRKDVPAGALALSVAAQRNLEGWVAQNRPDSTFAQAVNSENGETNERN